MIMAVMSTCSDPVLAGILGIVRNIMTIIQIVVPIILIIWSTIEFLKLTTDPEAKGGNKKIINKFVAAAIVFFIPVFVNAVMTLVGESTNFSSCWKKGKDISVNVSSAKDGGGTKQKEPDASKYEKAK